MLRDAPHWLASIGMTRARAGPQHALARVRPDRADASREPDAGLDGRGVREGEDPHDAAVGQPNPLSIDSTCYEQRHRSRHDDRVCRKVRLREGGKPGQGHPGAGQRRPPARPLA